MQLSGLCPRFWLEELDPCWIKLFPLTKQLLFLVGGELIMRLSCRRLSIPWGRTKGKGGYIALKIDLEKAYDKLE